MAQQVDGSGRYAEAISTPTSPPSGYASPVSEMMENTPPIPIESHQGFTTSADKKHLYNPATDYSGLEAVDPHPPQYGQYGGPPPGSPPPPNQATPFVHDKEQQAGPGEAVPHYNEEPKIFGLKRRTFFIALFGVVAVVVLAIAIGVGLGVGLNKDDDNSNTVVSDPICREHPDVCVGGALNAEYYSKRGAFNGTGIAIAGESWNKDQRRIFTLYFQHHTGDLRYMQYRTDRKWEGGDKTYTVASDAKNGTAISAVSYALNGTQYFHLFYITKNNTVKQITQSNSTEDSGHWKSGSLTNLNLKAFDSPTVGLQACWKGDYYGDSNPVEGGEVSQADLRGINIWFASDKSTFEQYSWNNGKDEWVRESPWTGKNAYAGVGCYSWDTAPLAYTMMVSDKNATEFWWKDTNSSLTSTDVHPINSWKNSTGGSIQGVYPLTAMGYTNYFYMQMADKSMQGFEVNWSAENTSLKTDPFVIRDLGGPVYGIAGTHLSATAYTEYKDVQNGNQTTKEKQWDSLYVFYQTTGDDIGAFSRPINGGEWTKGTLTIPQE